MLKDEEFWLILVGNSVGNSVHLSNTSPFVQHLVWCASGLGNEPHHVDAPPSAATWSQPSSLCLAGVSRHDAPKPSVPAARRAPGSGECRVLN
jgi:hypothetical protein